MRSHSKFLTCFLRCKKGEPINWSAGRHLSPNLNRLLGQSLIFSSSLWGGRKFCSITNPHLIFETCLRHFGICSLRYDRKRSMKIGWITRSSWTYIFRFLIQKSLFCDISPSSTSNGCQSFCLLRTFRLPKTDEILASGLDQTPWDDIKNVINVI